VSIKKAPRVRCFYVFLEVTLKAGGVIAVCGLLGLAVLVAEICIEYLPII